MGSSAFEENSPEPASLPQQPHSTKNALLSGSSLMNLKIVPSNRMKLQLTSPDNKLDANIRLSKGTSIFNPPQQPPTPLNATQNRSIIKSALAILNNNQVTGGERFAQTEKDIVSKLNALPPLPKSLIKLPHEQINNGSSNALSRSQNNLSQILESVQKPQL
jgi:hypothetical protein